MFVSCKALVVSFSFYFCRYDKQKGCVSYVLFKNGEVVSCTEGQMKTPVFKRELICFVKLNMFKRESCLGGAFRAVQSLSGPIHFSHSCNFISDKDLQSDLALKSRSEHGN